MMYIKKILIYCLMIIVGFFIVYIGSLVVGFDPNRSFINGLSCVVILSIIYWVCNLLRIKKN